MKKDDALVRICGKCQRAEFRTCSRCHRHRKVASIEADKPVCRACSEGGLKECASCGDLMPAGRGSRCETCDFRARLNKRAAISAAALGSPTISQAFLDYSEWLCRHAGAAKASRLITKHLHFFQEIDRRWTEVPSSAVLLDAFGTAGLRRALLVTRFLAVRTGDAVGADAKAESAEWGRINAACVGIPIGTPARALLERYRDALLWKHESGGLKLTSVRLALSAAKGLLLASAESPRALPDQASLLRYVKGRPGQRAALSGFVGHLRREASLQLVMPKARVATSAQKRRDVEAQLKSLLVQRALKPQERRRLLCLALRHLHGLPSGTAMRLGRPELLAKGSTGDWHLLIDGRKYWIPTEVIEAIDSGP